ncbi:hypothetical protein UFOVP1236_2 [uncultured Caudovirales phage]|uniref:DUF5675 domain-containing protein n=1 Tax=uncultured Caudovirales phage TaxID=2100421 RepID=A0A6J5RC90_9CAUD|nr:hypothetical protein UFOVP1236_2 [uncultured Caudovirales phage]
MTLTVQRRASQPWGTMGRLSIDGVATCWTLEDVVRLGPKVAHETAIPAGTYQVIIDRSIRFEKMLPRLLRVPDFEGVRLHSGNVAADSSGCLLLGMARSATGVTRSREAMSLVQSQIAMALAKGDIVTIEVKNA